MMELMLFPHGEESKEVNFIEEISTNHMFGILLLNDKTGAKMRAIKSQFCGAGCTAINQHILSLWLEGGGKQPVNWATLAEVLEKCRLNRLSTLIRTEKSKH